MKPLLSNFFYLIRYWSPSEGSALGSFFFNSTKKLLRRYSKVKLVLEKIEKKTILKISGIWPVSRSRPGADPQVGLPVRGRHEDRDRVLKCLVPSHSSWGQSCSEPGSITGRHSGPGQFVDRVLDCIPGPTRVLKDSYSVIVKLIYSRGNPVCTRLA